MSITRCAQAATDAQCAPSACESPMRTSTAWAHGNAFTCAQKQCINECIIQTRVRPTNDSCTQHHEPSAQASCDRMSVVCLSFTHTTDAHCASVHPCLPRRPPRAQATCSAYAHWPLGHQCSPLIWYRTHYTPMPVAHSSITPRCPAPIPITGPNGQRPCTRYASPFSTRHLSLAQLIMYVPHRTPIMHPSRIFFWRPLCTRHKMFAGIVRLAPGARREPNS